MIAFTALTSLFLATAAYAETTVCTPTLCLTGTTNLSLSSLPVSSSTLVLPGYYPSSTLSSLKLSSLPSSASLPPAFNLTSSISTLALSSGLYAFAGNHFSNDATWVPGGNSTANMTRALGGVGSFMLGEEMYAVLESGDKRVVVWSSIPSVVDLAVFQDADDIALTHLASSACDTPCTYPGYCSASTATCVCPTGFTGERCDACAEGLFGPTCTACPSDCKDGCDDGVGGSGQCKLASTQTPLEECNCLNGLCSTGGGVCACSAGWADSSSTSNGNGTHCATCADGFFKNTDGECQACQPGCLTCSSLTKCNTCADGLQVSSDSPGTCAKASHKFPGTDASNVTCSDGKYWDGGACSDCDSSCNTCSGAGNKACTSCSGSKALLGQTCVSVDQTTGACAHSTASGAFIVDNSRNVCTGCDAKCTGCRIPSFSSSASLDSAVCTGCIAGHLLAGGSCELSCPGGTYADGNGRCQACDSSCATCSGSSTFCTSCSSSSAFAVGGKCTSATSCSAGYYQPSSGTKACAACHATCGTCSGSGADQCLTCSKAFPVLTSDKRCQATCDKDQYFDQSTASCKSCDSSCGTCSGSGKSACLTCSDTDKVVSGGTCISAKCSGSLSALPDPSLGICLSSLVAVTDATKTTTSSAAPTAKSSRGSTKLPTWAILLIALLPVLLIIAFILWLRWRNRKRRLAKTREFADAIDDKEVEQRRYELALYDAAYERGLEAGKRDSGPPFTNVAATPMQMSEIPLTPAPILAGGDGWRSGTPQPNAAPCQAYSVAPGQVYPARSNRSRSDRGSHRSSSSSRSSSSDAFISSFSVSAYTRQHKPLIPTPTPTPAPPPNPNPSKSSLRPFVLSPAPPKRKPAPPRPVSPPEEEQVGFAIMPPDSRFSWTTAGGAAPSAPRAEDRPMPKSDRVKKYLSSNPFLKWI